MPAPATISPVSSGIYSYSSDGFTVSGNPRFSQSRLRTFFTSTPTRTRMYTKGWAVAQLQHYGLAVPKGTKDVVMKALQKAAVSGECASVPASIVAIEEALKQRYDTALAEAAKKHKAALAEESKRREAELADQARRREAAFAAENDPAKAACIDFDRFLCRYFLDATGKVDFKKAPKALPLHGLSNSLAALAAAEKYDGLHTRSGGIDDYSTGQNRVLVIGCDYRSVCSEAMKITREHEEQLEEDEEERLAEHYEFVKRNGKKKGGPSGAYTVICDKIESGWPDVYDDGLTLDIGADRERKGELAAEFDWGVVDGLMRFCKDGGYEEEEEVPVSRARKHSNKKSAPKAENSDPFKLHFSWRGKETGEGEIQNSEGNRGWIQFLNKKYLQFEGEVSISFVGRNVKFSGYKISTDTENFTKRWGDYSEEAYERERVGRWRW